MRNFLKEFKIMRMIFGWIFTKEKAIMKGLDTFGGDVTLSVIIPFATPRHAEALGGTVRWTARYPLHGQKLSE